MYVAKGHALQKTASGLFQTLLHLEQVVPAVLHSLVEKAMKRNIVFCDLPCN